MRIESAFTLFPNYCTLSEKHSALVAFILVVYYLCTRCLAMRTEVKKHFYEYEERKLLL